jgi:hypothetical protein
MKRKVNLKDLIAENKNEILLNKKEVSRIEEKLEEKHFQRLLLKK